MKSHIVGNIVRCRNILAVFLILAQNSLPSTADEPIDAIWNAWKNRQDRLQTISFEWIEKTTTQNPNELQYTTNWTVLFGTNSNCKLTLDIRYRRPEDERRKITVLSSPKFEMTCWESSRKTSEATILPGGSGCWNLETTYRFLQPLFRPTDECTPQDFTVSNALSSIGGQPCISVSRTQFYVRDFSIVTTLYVSPEFDYLPLRRVVEMRDDHHEPYRTVDTQFRFETIDGDFVPRSWFSTTTFREQAKQEKTMASVVKIDLNTALDTDTFQVALMPGTQLTDRRERDDMQPTTLRTQMLLNGTAKPTTEGSDEPSHEPKSP